MKIKATLVTVTRRTTAVLRRLGILTFAGMKRLGKSRVARALRRPALLLSRDVALGAIAAGLLLLIGAFSFVKVRPGEVAVRQVNWGSSSGIEAEDHAPGLYFSPPFFDSWHHLDARTRVVSFSWESEGGQYPILEVRTREGNSAQAAVTVPYRIRSGRAHRIVEDGIKLSWERRVKTTVEKVLLEDLAELGSEEFADTDRRLAVCDRALAKLNTQLAAHHVEADGIYITGVYFPPTWEKKQQQRQLDGQTLKTDRVLAQLKAKLLQNDFKAQELDREEQELVAELDRELEAERVRAVDQEIERQKLENEFLVQGLAKEEQELIDALTLEYQELQREEYELPLHALQLENAAAEQRHAQELLDAAEALDRAFAEERLAMGVRRLEDQRLAGELAAQALARESQDLVAELSREIETERLAHRGLLLSRRRTAEAESTRRRLEADLAYERAIDEGALAMEQAETVREGLRAAALATPGGRLYLAREAASQLRFDKVVLNSNDPRVPSVLDLDQLVGLLIGVPAETAGDAE